MKTTFYFLFVCVLLLNGFPLIAQESEKPFVVSPLIGDTLSLEERNYYKLLPTINEFRWAVFYLNTDSTLNVNVAYQKNNSLQDTLIQNYRNLYSLLIHLNAAENPIQNEDYADNKVSIIYNNGMEAEGNLFSATSSSLIIYSLECDEDDVDINCVTLISNKELEKLKVNSEFNLGRLLYPVVLGIASMIIYKNSLDSEKENLDNMMENFLAGFAVGLGGAVVGFAISYAIPLKISSEEEYSLPLNEDEIEGLSKIARYKDFEPHYNLLKRGMK